MPSETPARRKIRAALQALGYEPKEIVWNGAWSPVDFGADGGFSVDGFGAFASADECIEWMSDPENFACFKADTEWMRDGDASREETADVHP